MDLDARASVYSFAVTVTPRLNLMDKARTRARARRSLLLCALLLCAHAAAFAQSGASQTAPADAKEPAAISGRVTSEGKPAPDVSVILMHADYEPQMKSVARATTDDAGRFKLTNVPPGKYQLTTVSPGYVFAEMGTNPWQPGKILNVAAGDELKDLDFTLVRGGVVTGRVTDPDGKPVVEGTVTLVAADPRERRADRPRPVTSMTDDRGIYRAWGVAPGRYIVYAGRGGEDHYQFNGNDESGFYPQTFYPSATEEAQAKSIEVATGSETEDIDIVLGKLVRTYVATGRVVGDDGKPVGDLEINVGSLVAGERRFNGNMFNGGKTDERGEFRVRGLVPGEWGAWATAGEFFSGKQGPTFSEPAFFTVSDSDVSGLEIKMVRGASLSGVLTIEGTSDPAILAKRNEINFSVWMNAGLSSASVPNYVRLQLAPDGSFHVEGLRPGKTMFDIADWPRPKGLSLLYIRRDGVEQREGIEVKAGEQVKNVQVAYAYGTSVVRGQVEFRGGARPDGVAFGVRAARPGGLATGNTVELDSLGRFTIENLSAGEYELTLNDWSSQATNRSPLAKVTISVPESGEVRATLVYDMTPKVKEN